MARLPLVALALAALVGCEDDVDPTLGLDIPFSLYGYLDPTADRQAIRVAPIALSIDAPKDTIDAAVTSTDLATGVTTVWRDSLHVFADGTLGHVFVADVTPAPGSRVRIEARRSDGAVTTVDVDAPPFAVATVGVGALTPGEVTYPVRFEGAPRVLSGVLRLTVANTGVGDGVEILDIPVEAQPAETEPDVWTIDVPFLTTVDEFMRQRGLRDTGVELVQALYQGFVTNEAWAVPVDDVDALVEPGTFSNVEAGLGFVGAGYTADVTWKPSPTVLASLGFEVDDLEGELVRMNELQIGDRGWVEFYNPLLYAVSLDDYYLSDTPFEPRKQRIPPQVTIPPLGFLVVDLEFQTFPDSTVGLYNREGDLLQRIYLERPLPAGATYGSWPDGRSFRIPQERDMFVGPLAPTPGLPNERLAQPGAINEIYTEGDRGFVEVVVDSGAGAPVVLTEPRRYLEAYRDGVFPLGYPFAVVGEVGRVVDLPQLGGEVLLLLDDRVVDVYEYGGQSPGRSVGRLPDRTGPFQTGLRPTRGAPNALPRLGI
ncbi:hypothetical protein [Rubrivirga sp. IMCC43871]|uniref:hypothetical protein n=1 Tax=Rubrivirga sp. IMCC43871 TaxID=3391575 RepID=UPI00398F9A38